MRNTLSAWRSMSTSPMYTMHSRPSRAAAVAAATPCWPAPVSATSRVLPMRLASRAWPSTLLILCEPVWLRSSRLSSTRQPSSAGQVGALGEQRRPAGVVAQQAVELARKPGSAHASRNAASSSWHAGTSVSGTNSPPKSPKRPGGPGSPITGRWWCRSWRGHQGRGDGATEGGVHPSNGRRSRQRSSSIQSKGRTSRSPCAGCGGGSAAGRPRRRPGSCGRPCGRGRPRRRSPRRRPTGRTTRMASATLSGGQAAGQDDPPVGRRPLGQRPVEHLARARAWPSRPGRRRPRSRRPARAGGRRRRRP